MILKFARILLRPSAALAGLAAVLMLMQPASAQNTDPAQNAFRMATNALALGDYGNVVKQMTAAIGSNQLTSNNVAKALYFRGTAFQRGGRPAEAISDLTNAIWLTGLSASERARAYLGRGLAYRAVGMDTLANNDLKQAKAIAPNDPQIAQAIGGGAQSSGGTFAGFGPQGMPMPMGPGFRPGMAPGPQAGMGAAPMPMPTPAATPPAAQASAPKQPAAGPAEQKVAAAPADAPKPQPAAQAKPAPAPAASKPPAAPRAEFPSWATSVTAESQDGAGEQSTAETEAPDEEQPGRLKRFFGSIWGSDDDEEPGSGDEEGVWRAVVATAEWSKSTKVEEINERADAPASAGRSYRIQLASSRSEDEARSYWQRISAQHRGIVGEREPIIEKTELGTLGTFYRLQLGPFEDKRQSLQLCNSFKRSGVECFLVTK